MSSRNLPLSVGAWAFLLVIAIPTPATAQDALTLSEAAERTLASHPLLAEARARTSAAEASRDGARAARLPALQLQASVTRFEEPMIVAPLHSLDLMNAPRFDETLVQGSLGASYALFDGGARGARIDGAGALVESADQLRTSTEMDVLSTLMTAYVGLSSSRTVLEASDAMVEALEAEFDRAQRQVDAGAAPRVQLLRASAALQDARAVQVTAESRVGLAVRDLARIMGVPPASISGRPVAAVPPATATPPTTDGVPPSVAAAVHRVEAAEATLSAERATRLPRLEAGAALLDFGTPTGEHVFEWQAGLRLSWSVFNGGARGAAVRRAEAALAEAVATAATARLNVARAEDAARAAVTGADARSEALEAAVAQWTEVTRIESLALESGAGVQSDLLQAQASLFQARAGLAQARADAVLARTRLAQAQGVLTMEWINLQSENP